MHHIKVVLESYSVDDIDIDALKSFESRDGFVLLEVDEFKDMFDYFQAFPVYHALIPVMTDDNSNYWCVYVDGPLKNMVCYLSHDEPSLEPRFSSLSSLINAIENNADSYYMDDLDEAVFDYPSRRALRDELREKEIIEALFAIFNTENIDDEILMQTAFSIMALTPPEEIEQNIYPFLDNEDMYIQERAIEILGFHRYQPAIGRLTELVTHAQHNGQTAAKIALTRIGA